jgi:phosphoribosylformimino-5-aminoimidazole carboxamide ribotide isomerase
MELFPAVDLYQGEAVRLVQGDFSRSRSYGDPMALARRYVDAGARWVHVVDLDAARTGEPVNRDTVLELIASVPVAVQVGGGIRRAEDADALLGAGAARVVIGTAALRDPALAAVLASRHPGRVAVGLDHRGGGAEVAVAGWEQGAARTLEQALAGLEGLPLAAVVITAIERDGMLEGPDVAGLASALGATRHPVVASGGVRSAADLRALRALRAAGRGLAGAIVGKALVDGVLAIEEAVAACAASE